jgi:predicted nuclease of predicted toxin-antitoxin system
LKLFIDECLSPALARHLNQSGVHDALHPRDYGRLGERDDEVLARCLAEDRVIVTENAADFRKLVAREDIHPGLIILPNVTRDASRALLLAAITYLETLGSPSDIIVNNVVEVDADGAMRLYPLP